jgi:two-component system cell cycle sensor histidine kinase/response regulator CckA
VIEASDGHQALILARTEHPDVVLTDVLMPGLDGYQLVRELLNDAETATIPVVFYTANYSPSEAQPLATAAGVGKILSKDATPQELLDAVAEVLSDQAVPPAATEAEFDAQHLSTVNAKLLENVRALDESHARFAALADASPVGMVIADSRGLATYVSPRLYEITQAPADSLLGPGWQRCLSDGQRQAFRAAPRQLPARQDGQRQREHLTLPDGEQRWLTVLIRPVRDSEDTVTGYVATIDDITAMVQVDERRFAEDCERERDGRRQLAVRFDGLVRLAGGMAHDFNNLLNIVMSFDQFIGDAVTDASGALLSDAQAQSILSDVSQVHRAAQRAAHLTHQLLTFGGREAVQPAVVDINALVGEVCDMIAGTIGQHVTISTRLDPLLRPVLVDPSQISQVLLSLAIIARNAMPDGGTLHFETANTRTEASERAASPPAGDYVHIAVTDTGHGMSAATVRLALEPFFTTKPGGQGTGLGLATSNGVIKQAGGLGGEANTRTEASERAASPPAAGPPSTSSSRPPARLPPSPGPSPAGPAPRAGPSCSPKTKTACARPSPACSPATATTSSPPPTATKPSPSPSSTTASSTPSSPTSPCPS